MYADGSEAKPFPLFCLPRATKASKAKETNPLKISLMSMRHLELDPEIDFCWFRNREARTGFSAASLDMPPHHRGDHAFRHLRRRP